jgi:hypothetical protein
MQDHATPLWITGETLMAIQLERIALLLQVANLASQWPNLNGITSLASEELVEANKEVLKQIEEKRKKEAEERQKKHAEALAAEEKKSDDDDEPPHTAARRI